MKKTFLILFLASIVLVGCQSTQPKQEVPVQTFDGQAADVPRPTQTEPSVPTKVFDKQSFIPATATSSTVYSLDLDGDGTEEKAIHYVNRDNVDGEGLFSKRDHINIYQLRENNWETNYEYIFPLINKDTGMRDWKSFVKEEPDTRIGSVAVVDVGNDGNQELLVKNENSPFGDWRFNGYEVIGERDGKILILNLPMGPEKRNIPISFYGRMLDVDCVNGNIAENWGATCEGGVNPCYTFEFEISYEPSNNSWKFSKAKNIQQVKAEWDKYIEEYGEKEWTGTLPF